MPRAIRVRPGPTITESDFQAFDQAYAQLYTTRTVHRPTPQESRIYIPIGTRVELTGPIHDLSPSDYEDCHGGIVTAHNRGRSLQNHQVLFDSGDSWWVAPESLTEEDHDFKPTGNEAADAIMRVIRRLHRRQRFYQDNKDTLQYWP